MKLFNKENEVKNVKSGDRFVFGKKPKGKELIKLTAILDKQAKKQELAELRNIMHFSCSIKFKGNDDSNEGLAWWLRQIADQVEANNTDRQVVDSLGVKLGQWMIVSEDFEA